MWHPYTQMSEYEERDPVIITRGQGRRLQDASGRWYWDGVSSIWLNVHGHRVPAIDKAVRDQLGRVAHSTLLGQGNEPSIELAAQLAEVAPKGLDHVFYSDNGSCANEAALRMVSHYWKRKGEGRKRRVLTFEGGYHGDTLANVGLAPVSPFHDEIADTLPGALQAPYPQCYRDEGTGHPDDCADDHLDRVEDVLRRHARDTAAVLVEPMVQFVGGLQVMPTGFLRGLRDLCDRHDVLLVADEVATGFGRTATMWACDHERVVPDLLTVGKGITGGYLPLAATLADDALFGSFLGRYEDRRQLFYGHSFTGNQLACAAALASLRLLRRLLPNLPAKADWLKARLQKLRAMPFVGDVRCVGFAAGIELVADARAKTPFPWEARSGWVVADRARHHGMLVRPIGNVSLFVPPLASTQRELASMVDILERAHEESGPALQRLAAQGLEVAA